MRLAIVGSKDLINNPEVENIIRAAIVKYWPDTLVSGGAIGVDSSVKKIADEQNISIIEFLPKGKGWYYYKMRNKLIAENCDRLIRITYPEATTYGSGWTRDYAKSLGIPTEEFIVNK